MVTRRDFINGMAATIALGGVPIPIGRAAQPGYYPPALQGLRGSHSGAFEAAHQLAWKGVKFPVEGLASSEDYDLVIVGGGISGLSAAYFYREKFGRDKRVLIVENHDDFGGHAKRNEFELNGRMILGYGGTETIQGPKSQYSDVAAGLLKELAIDVDRFKTAFDRSFYSSKGLGRGVFFDKKNWGEDKVVIGDPFWMTDDDQRPDELNDRPLREFLMDFPLSKSDRQALIDFHESRIDHLAEMSMEEKESYLRKTSYRDYIAKNAGLSETAAKYFQGRFNDLFALSSDTVDAFTAMWTGFPGFGGIGFIDPDAHLTDGEDPYINHFPDGNASIARLLVRKLIPGAAEGSTMEDIVTAKFDYSKLDLAESPVRLRLNSIAVNVVNVKGGVEVSYVRDNNLYKVRGRKVILAGYNMMIPFLMPEIAPDQQDALRLNVKMPLVYTNVILKNWRSFMELGAHDVYSPTSFYARLKLDYPVSLGDYRFATTPDDPICVHMYSAQTTPGRGLDAREQARLGRAYLFETPYDEMEATVRDQLSGLLSGTGFDFDRDVDGITVNRWPHGYSNGINSLVDNPEEMLVKIAMARRPVGNVSIANSDSGWSALTQTAIDQAWRAVNEL